MSAEDKSSSAASSSSLALPAELLLKVCLCLEAVDVLRLGVVERRAVDVCRSDAVWRRLYNLRFRRKAVVPDDRLLGASFLRMYRQEIFAKALSHMGKTLEVAAHRGMALDAVGPCDLHDESKLVIYLRGGQIRVHSLALEGQQIGAAHLVENASSIRAEEEREERRQDLSAAHKNALLQFKISHGSAASGALTPTKSAGQRNGQEARRNAGFSFWSDDEEEEVEEDEEETVNEIDTGALQTQHRSQGCSIVDQTEGIETNSTASTSTRQVSLRTSRSSMQTAAATTTRTGASPVLTAKGKRLQARRARLATAEPQACSASSASGTSIGSDPLCTASADSAGGLSRGSSMSSAPSICSASTESECSWSSADSFAAGGRAQRNRSGSLSGDADAQTRSGRGKGNKGSLRKGQRRSQRARHLYNHQQQQRAPRVRNKPRKSRGGNAQGHARRGWQSSSDDKKVAALLDVQANCATVDIQKLGWHVFQCAQQGCAQAHLIAPRWSRHADAPLTGSAFVPGLSTRGPVWTGGRLFSWEEQPSATQTKSDGNTASAPGLGIKLASSIKSSKPSHGEEKVLIATGHANGAILLWGQACTFLGAIDAASDKAVRILAVRGQRVAAASATGVAVWEVPSARKIANMPTDGAVEAIQMLDEIIVAGTARGGVHIWTRAGRSVFTARDTHDGPVTCLRCLAINEANTPLGADNEKGGPSFVVASAGGSSHEIVLRRFKEQHRECLLRGRDLQCDMTRVLRGHAGAVRDLYMDSYRIVSCGDDGTIKFWDAEDAETRVVRSVKFKRAKHRAPLTQLIVGTSFVAASRGNGGLVAFTLLSDWADLAPAEPSTRAQVADAGEASAAGLPSTDATPRSSRRSKTSSTATSSTKKKRSSRNMIQRDDYLEMLFEETFDVYDLQEAHDLLNYGFASR